MVPDEGSVPACGERPLILLPLRVHARHFEARRCHAAVASHEGWNVPADGSMVADDSPLCCRCELVGVQAMNVDLLVLKLLNSFAHRSSVFDASVGLLADLPLLKGALLTSVLWLAWFQPNRDQKLRRELVISTLAATITSLVLTKIIRSLLPFRLRPMHDAASGFTLPYYVTSETLWNWSSFPSDTAAMSFALAGGVLMIWGRWGWLAILYSLVVVCIPRIYLGYHYPSDVAAGALIGIVSAFVIGRDEIRPHLSGRLLSWCQRYPGAFYCAFFVLTYEVSAVFENTRQIMVAVAKLFRGA
jgi:undecaprenyl-diphosphatase